jgi:3',5'-cyclic AMP phosphodiesterase CpdA
VAAHQSVVNRIVALAPDFVLHNGDFVEDGSVVAQWTTFFAVEQGLLRQAPLYGALGNHEMNSPNYFDAFHLPGNERWYSFDYGDAHIVALEMDDYADYGPGNPQYTWLDNDLASTDRQWKIVFFHIPPYSPAAQSTLVPLLARHGVDIVFNGHDHLYERTVFSDVVYIISGGGGAPLYSRPPNPYSAYYTNTYHCVSITVNGRSLTSVGVRPDGVEFDPSRLQPAVAAFHRATGHTILLLTRPHHGAYLRMGFG